MRVCSFGHGLVLNGLLEDNVRNNKERIHPIIIDTYTDARM